MNRKWLWIAGIAALAIGFCVLALRTPHDGPVQGGRTARVWLLEMLRSEPARQEAARNAFRAMGDEAIPFLKGELTRRDSLLKRAWMDLDDRFPWLHAGGVRDARWRTAAIHTVGVLGGRGAVLMPELLSAFYERETVVGSHGFGVAFNGIGSEAVPALVQALGEKRTPPCGYDDELLLPLGTICRQETLPSHVIDAVMNIAMARLEHPRRGFEALAAIHVILSAPEHAQSAVPSLIQLLQHENAEVRQAGITALGAVGGNPIDVVPALVGCLDDSRSAVRVRAVKALLHFELDGSPSAVSALAGRVGDESMAVSLAALSALGQLGRVAIVATPDVLDVLNHPEASVRAMAAKTLPRIQPAAEPVLQGLMRALNDEDRDVKLNAARSLGDYGADAGPAIDVLIGVLQADHREAVQITVAEALGRIGPAAARAVPHLITAWNNNQSAMREPVQQALLKIRGGVARLPEQPGEAP